MYRRILPNIKESTRQIVYVPPHKPANNEDFEILKDFLTEHGKVLFLTGAGISTESGIPDYRSEEVGLYARSNHKPVQYQEFVKYPRVRQRYWARNFIGWPRFSSIQPNATHFSLRELEKIGKVTSIVTQNVDRLHHKAGSKNVIELHGTGYIVKCMNCPYEITRAELQVELQKKNPDMESNFSMIRPDGDVELSKVGFIETRHNKTSIFVCCQAVPLNLVQEVENKMFPNMDQVENFKSPLCPECEGPLKPDIVFFGDNVPKKRVELVKSQVSASDAVFVLGSSLTVYSSYRIILQAKEENKSIAILNIGPTRADNVVDIKVSTKCGDILPELYNSIAKYKP